ncbi:pentatricopeptide repeat-containing protein At5g16860-like [Tripterygium wilfordii]|uniref:pentatricopeptide repeat-containing protein At5g16860-like n=1 Tax=Tripterygium wilfordii TaxID=458696 RepID=UPI0018F82B38|nr:pentatricopeptide repeat-containing protein At5g16860-like [Tripterygium wilfordii]
MRWACSITNPLLKRVQFPSLVTIATDGVVNTLEFFHQYQTRSHGSSVSGDYTNVLMVEALHAQSVKDGSLQNLSMNNYLLDLYVKSSNLHCAHKLFDEMPTQDVRSWTILVSGFARNGYPTVVFECFRKMQTEGVCPNQITLSIVFKCCSSLREFRNGMAIHGWILRNGIAEDIVLENSILDHYVKCRAFDYAIRLFGLMKQKDTVSWNIMIGAYLLLGDVEKSVDLFRSLPFKDVASWNTLLNGLTRNGFERAAVKLLYEMVESGPPLNEFSFSVALVMVSSLSILKLGKQIHSQVLRLGIHNDGFIRNSLVDMYCKCGKMGEALAIFRKMPMENLTVQSEKAATYDKSMEEIVLCSSIVSGYVRNGDYKDAMKTFSTLVCKHVKVDGFTLTSIVSACANARNLGYGRQVHGYIQKVGQKVDTHLGSSLIDMYSKCGSLNDAGMIFRETKSANVVVWTSMISACALHGQGEEALQLFDNMITEGIRPNEVTFVGVLTACSHTGQLEEGCRYFSLMKEYGIKPGIEHFTCIVDLYGRAGHLTKVKEFIDENGISHLTAVWRSFLSSCCLHKNVEMGKWVSEMLLQLEPSDAGPYVLSSNMFANSHSWEEVARVRTLMQQRGVNKLPGQSRI